MNGTEQKQSESKSNNEIDLVQLFSSIGNKIGDFIKLIFKGTYNIVEKIILSSLYFVIRNFIYFTIICIISIGLIYVKKVVSTPYYRSQMKVKANTIGNQEAISYINRLGEIAATKENVLVLAEELKIDSANAAKIKSIGAYWFIDLDNDGVDDYIDVDNEYFKSPDDSLSSRITKYFSIRMEYLDSLDVPVIGDKIIEYVNSNPYFIKSNEIRKLQQKEDILLTKAEQIKLDTIRSLYYKSIFEKQSLPESQQGQLVFLNGDPSDKDLQELKLFHSQMFEFEQAQQNLKKSLELDPEIISLIENFTVSKQRISSFIKDATYGILFFIMGFIVILIIENRKKLIELKKQSSLK